MEYSAQSLHFLHVAYILMASVQLAYVGFLVKKWRDATDAALPSGDDDA